MIEDDFTIDEFCNIRHVEGKTDLYTVLELHRYLYFLAETFDHPYLSLFTDRASIRQTDHIIELQGDYNIDEEAAKFLRNGSITQRSGKEIFSGGLEEYSI